jgi:hypothetical protein
LNALFSPSGTSLILTATICHQAHAQSEQTEQTLSEDERFGDATVDDSLKRLPGISFTGRRGS